MTKSQWRMRKETIEGHVFRNRRIPPGRWQAYAVIDVMRLDLGVPVKRVEVRFSFVEMHQPIISIGLTMKPRFIPHCLLNGDNLNGDAAASFLLEVLQRTNNDHFLTEYFHFIEEVPEAKVK